MLVVVAGALNLWSLRTNSYANVFYSAADRSMSGSWHLFLYNSFDEAGVMTVDKFPLAMWVQAMSVDAFGLSPWSVLVPQALMGIAAVALTYDLARQRFGRPAGFVAGLVLALTPITVAISRHNNPDALLILCCVAAVWLVVRGLEDGRTRWLVLSGIAIGLGFETKMAAALLVVPALAAAWLWVSPRGIAAAGRSLVAGGVAMVVVGGAWPVFVALTPASERPWVGGTGDNSVWSLMLSYNGLGRLLGQAGGPTSGVIGPFGGAPGPLRLLDPSLGGQAGWLLGFALVAGIGVAVATRLRRGDPRTGWLIAVGGSFATIAVAFSQAQGIFHPYYVSLLAPFTALLVGAGAGLALRSDWPGRVIGPLAIVAGLVCELVILHDNQDELRWLPVVLLAGVSAAAVLLGPAGSRPCPDRRDRGGAGPAPDRAGHVVVPDAGAPRQRDLPRRRPGRRGGRDWGHRQTRQSRRPWPRDQGGAQVHPRSRRRDARRLTPVRRDQSDHHPPRSQSGRHRRVLRPGEPHDRRRVRGGRGAWPGHVGPHQRPARRPPRPAGFRNGDGGGRAGRHPHLHEAALPGQGESGSPAPPGWAGFAIP